MVSARIIVIVAKNDNKRIVRYNHLPQKRRLLEVVEKWKIKRTKLNKDLRIQINEYSNEYKFVYNKCFLKCPVYFEKIEIPTKNLSLTGKILPARKPRSPPHPHLIRICTVGSEGVQLFGQKKWGFFVFFKEGPIFFQSYQI